MTTDRDVARPCCFILGTPAILGPDGEPVEITAGKLRLLLAELVVHRGQWVETSTLVDALWGERVPESAMGNLQTYVFDLRRRLPTRPDGAPWVASRKGAYRLNLADGELDADRFATLIDQARVARQQNDPARASELLHQALKLWRGDPFTQVSQQSVLTEAARLRELHHSAIDLLGESLTAEGKPEQAAATLRGLVTEAPLRETTWARLLAALRAAGRNADALDAYEQARRVLDAELGTRPGTELRAHHRELLAESAESDAAPPATAGPIPRADHGIDRLTAAAPATATADAGGDRTERRWWRRPSALRVGLSLVAVAALTTTALVIIPNDEDGAAQQGPQAAPAQPIGDEVAGYPDSVRERRPVPDFPAQRTPPRMLFGSGSNAARAQESELVRSGGIGMLSSTIYKHEDIEQFESWRTRTIPDFYRQGKALHLRVVPNQKQGKDQFDSPYGPVCGHEYPVSDEFLTDMKTLAQTFAGAADGPPLYVSMYHGLEKLSCSPEGYRADPYVENYYRMLKDSYLKVVAIFHRYAPNARVGLNWDGWEATTDNPRFADGRSMFQQFTREFGASDFVGFSAFESGDENIAAVNESVAELGKFGLPVMLTDYQPYDSDGESVENQTYQNDLRTVFQPDSLSKLIGQGLFAWSFRSTKLMDRDEESRRITTDVVARYGRR